VNPANIATSLSANMLDGVGAIEQAVASTSLASSAEAKNLAFFLE
jgi:hypothetical protein